MPARSGPTRNGHEIADGRRRIGKSVQLFIILKPIRSGFQFAPSNSRSSLDICAPQERLFRRNQRFGGIEYAPGEVFLRPENFVHVLYWLKVVILRGSFTAIEIEIVIAFLDVAEPLLSRLHNSAPTAAPT